MQHHTETARLKAHRRRAEQCRDCRQCPGVARLPALRFHFDIFHSSPEFASAARRHLEDSPMHCIPRCTQCTLEMLMRLSPSSVAFVVIEMHGKCYTLLIVLFVYKPNQKGERDKVQLVSYQSEDMSGVGLNAAAHYTLSRI